MNVKCILSEVPATLDIAEGYHGDVAIVIGGGGALKAFLTPSDAIQFGLELIAFANKQLQAQPMPASTSADGVVATPLEGVTVS